MTTDDRRTDTPMRTSERGIDDRLLCRSQREVLCEVAVDRVDLLARREIDVSRRSLDPPRSEDVGAVGLLECFRCGKSRRIVDAIDRQVAALIGVEECLKAFNLA